MRWPWSDSKPSREATHALEEAEADLRRVKGQRPEVSEVSRALREHREKNQFAARIEALIREGA